ncbi:MAG: NADH-quinone oxidoreductase subunit K [Rickettsiales bacterium]|jgi:NADH-quinone oxidoreductase subunit K
MVTIGIYHFLFLSSALFCIGISGMFINRKNIISLLMSLEIMLLAVNINFVAFSSMLNDLVGQIFAIFVLTIAAAEAAIGLAILVIYQQNKHNIEVEQVSVMKG